MRNFHHNKKRNSGLVYEFLVRRMGLALVDGRKDQYSKAVEILKKYYSPGQPLSEEREIFDVVTKSRGLSEHSSRKMIDEVRKHVSHLDPKKIEIKKSNLIKEIHYAFGQDFFDVHRIPQYRLFASIQMLIEQYKSKSSLTESSQRIQLEESLVNFMMTKDNVRTAQVGEKVDSLVAAIAVKKFEERYSGTLNESQKKLMRKFMNYSMSGNTEQFSREMEKERQTLVESLSKSLSLDYFRDDNIMKERMNVAIDSLKNLKNMTSDSSVKEILLYQKLKQEIDSNE